MQARENRAKGDEKKQSYRRSQTKERRQEEMRGDKKRVDESIEEKRGEEIGNTLKSSMYSEVLAWQYSTERKRKEENKTKHNIT